MNFYDLFPTPKFISMQSVGLSLLDDSICFVDLERGEKNKISLKSYGQQELEPSILEDGEIKNPEKLIEILSDFRKKHNLYFIKSALPEEKAFLFKTTLPEMSEGEIREALQFKIEENVPLSLNEVVYDFYKISNDSNHSDKAEGQKANQDIEVVVSVIPKNVISSYLDVFKKSGLVPMSFEIESQVIVRAVVKKENKKPVLVVHIKKEKVGLYIVDKGLVLFTSNVKLSKDYFSPKSFPQKEKPVENEDEKSNIFTKSEVGDVLKKEVEKLLDYWGSSAFSSSGSKIKQIIICAEDTPNFAIKNYFMSTFSIPVEQANVWTNAFSFDDYIPDLTFEESFKYSTSIGLELLQK